MKYECYLTVYDHHETEPLQGQTLELSDDAVRLALKLLGGNRNPIEVRDGERPPPPLVGAEAWRNDNGITVVLDGVKYFNVVSIIVAGWIPEAF